MIADLIGEHSLPRARVRTTVKNRFESEVNPFARLSGTPIGPILFKWSLQYSTNDTLF